MMKRILCLLAAALLCLILPAAAEENVNVVTAAELDELLESVRAQVLTEELLNDPAGEDAESEDGTFFMYGTAGVYAEGTELTADTPVNTLVFDYTEGPVFRGTGIDSRLDEVLAAFPLDNPELTGTREEAILYLRETEAGFAYGRLLRDGQWVNTVEYGEVVMDGELSCRTAVTYSLANGMVTVIRISGLNPAGTELMDASRAEEFYSELIELAGQEEYRAVKTSRNGLELTPLGAEDLTVGGYEAARLRLYGADGSCLVLVGESLGGGSFLMHSIDDIPIESHGAYYELFVMLQGEDPEVFKKLLLAGAPVQSSLYMDRKTTGQSLSYYNEETCSYYNMPAYNGGKRDFLWGNYKML